MKKTHFLKIWSISCIVGIISIYWWFKNEAPAIPQYDQDDIKNQYLTKQFEGVIIHKFVDRKQHYYQKIIFNDKGEDKVIILNWEKGGLFTFLQKGDTINKSLNSLDFKIKRKGLDTIISMSF